MRKNFCGLSKAARAFKCLIAKQENLVLKKRKLDCVPFRCKPQSICAIEVSAFYGLKCIDTFVLTVKNFNKIFTFDN